MKIESLRDVKALSKIVKKLPSEILFPVTNETDLEGLLLSQRKDFWQMLDRAHEEGEKKGFTKLEDLPS